MIFHEVEQNSKEWFELRRGKITTSKLGVVMANHGKAFSDTAKKYAFRLAKEQITGELEEEERYSNKHMENGHLYEPIALEAYEEKTFYEVTNGGFCEHEALNVGGSPDGLITPFNGGIEIKSVISWTQRTTLKRNSFDPSYRWQLLGNMWLCDLDWIDFVSYGYNYTEGKKLFTDRLDRDNHLEQLEMIEPRVNDFLELIENEKKYL